MKIRLDVKCGWDVIGPMLFYYILFDMMLINFNFNNDDLFVSYCSYYS